MAKEGKGGFVGAPVTVHVGPAPKKLSEEEKLVAKVRGLMIGRIVDEVTLQDENIVFWLSDGGHVAVACSGGIKEVTQH